LISIVEILVLMVTGLLVVPGRSLIAAPVPSATKVTQNDELATAVAADRLQRVMRQLGRRSCLIGRGAAVGSFRYDFFTNP